MDRHDRLADGFEVHCSRLRAMAYRMLGSTGDAEDAVQEAWLRLDRSDINRVQNLGGWLTTVVGRVCLDTLRSRAARREEPLDGHLPDPIDTPADEADPEREALLADSVGLALLVVLDADPRRAARLRTARHVRRALPRDRPHTRPYTGRG